MVVPALLAALLAAIVHVLPAPAADRITVVELFTSQGCSSCPPADAFLGELAQRPDVLALSHHVDYWDYLGWKDPHATRQNTLRQREYARKLGLAYVYTPQMVVQGTWQASGNDRDGVLRLLAAAAAGPGVSIELHRTNDAPLVARLPAAGLAGPADILLVRFRPRLLTRVAHGENRGRELVNHNVVLGFERVAAWSGEPLEVPVRWPDGGSAALIVQQSDTGRILGAARLDALIP